MLFLCQLLLNFQGAYTLIEVRSLSILIEILQYAGISVKDVKVLETYVRAW